MAARAGAILAGMHLGPAADPATAARFADTEFFETLRVDPYLWEVARAHPDLRPTIDEIVDDMSSHRRALVHGDYSPKNMLVHGGDLLVLDYEVAHWGDPAFDLAFCLNHFFLKAVYRPADGAAFCESARAFWAGYRPALALEGAATLLPRTLRLLGGLMLARIDGKSPVEYITEPAMQARVREIARRILTARRPRRSWRMVGGDGWCGGVKVEHPASVGSPSDQDDDGRRGRASTTDREVAVPRIAAVRAREVLDFAGEPDGRGGRDARHGGDRAGERAERGLDGDA